MGGEGTDRSGGPSAVTDTAEPAALAPATPRGPRGALAQEPGSAAPGGSRYQAALITGSQVFPTLASRSRRHLPSPASGLGRCVALWPRIQVPGPSQQTQVPGLPQRSQARAGPPRENTRLAHVLTRTPALPAQGLQQQGGTDSTRISGGLSGPGLRLLKPVF